MKKSKILLILSVILGVLCIFRIIMVLSYNANQNRMIEANKDKAINILAANTPTINKVKVKTFSEEEMMKVLKSKKQFDESVVLTLERTEALNDALIYIYKVTASGSQSVKLIGYYAVNNTSNDCYLYDKTDEKLTKLDWL